MAALPGPQPTPTPAATPLTYNDYLAKYLAQMGVAGGGPSASPTATPFASGAPAPGGGIVGGPLPKLAGVGLGAKIGLSLANSGGVGATLSPGFAPVALPTAQTVLPGLAPMLPGGASAAAAAPVAASTAASAATAGAAPAGVLTGASPALYFGGPLAFLAAGSALAPSIAKAGEKFGRLTGMVDNHINRPYNAKEAAASPIVQRQMPGLSSLSEADQTAILDKLHSVNAVSLPGNIDPTTGAVLRGIGRERIIPRYLRGTWDPKEHGNRWFDNRTLGEMIAAAPGSARQDQLTVLKDANQMLSDLSYQSKLKSALETLGVKTTAPAVSNVAAFVQNAAPVAKAPTGALPGVINFIQERSKTRSPGVSKDGKPVSSYWRK